MTERKPKVGETGFIEVTVSYQSAERIGGVQSNTRTTVPRLLNVAHIRYVKPAQWWDAAIGLGEMHHGSAVSVSEGVGSMQYDVAESYDEVKAMIVAATGSLPTGDVQKYVADRIALRARGIRLDDLTHAEWTTRDVQHLAEYEPVSPDAISDVLEAVEDDNADDGRSSWMWFRLPDGTLIFGCFPQGDLYFQHEDERTI